MGCHLVLTAKQSRAALGASLDPFPAAAPLPNFRSYLSLFSAGRASLRAIPPGSRDGGAKRRMRRTTRAAHLSRLSAPLWHLSSVVFTVAAAKTTVFRMGPFAAGRPFCASGANRVQLRLDYCIIY